MILHGDLERILISAEDIQRRVAELGRAITEEYKDAPEQDKPGTFLGRFIDAALAHKYMVTQAVYSSGSLMAGNPEEGKKRPFQWFLDLVKISKEQKKGGQP